MGLRTVPSKQPFVIRAPQPRSFVERSWGKLTLLTLTTALLTASFAPLGQFYLAYVALVPWLIVVKHSRSSLTAFLWGWLGGVIFFDANMWWLAYVTGPGLAALMAVLGLYWGVAAAIIRGTRLLEPNGAWSRGTASPDAVPCRWAAMATVLFIASIWTGLEWFRGVWPLGGLAWAYLGHTQSPVLHLCQIADFAGAHGVSFLVVMANAWAAMWVIHRRHARWLAPTAAMVVAAFVLVVVYGFFRISQKSTRTGPTVLVVQPNYPQSNSGEKGARSAEIVNFHLRETRQAMASHPGVDLVVWSETMMPPLNPQARQFALSLNSPNATAWAENLGRVDAALDSLVRQSGASLLAGGLYHDDWTIKADSDGAGHPVPLDRRNSAYFYTPHGPSGRRYDKIHLVPFGEYLPFQSTIPPLYRLFLALSPYTEEYTLTAGASGMLTVFQLPSGPRFVTPICFEDLDADLVRRMFKSESGPGKRADLIVNITNDGWFRFNELPQHFQAAVFRSIENRVPTARSVNTGISGFVDSLGRVSGRIPAGQEGTSVETLRLDDRVTFYSRFGDLFAYACAAVTILLIGWGVFRRVQQKRLI